MPEFDELAKQAFGHVADIMGEIAVWRSAHGGETPGKVLFRNPTEAVRLGSTEQYEYRPNTCTAEFHADTFHGLKQSVDAGELEYIEIAGKTYFINEITTKADGKTLVAHVEPAENEEQ